MLQGREHTAVPGTNRGATTARAATVPSGSEKPHRNSQENTGQRHRPRDAGTRPGAAALQPASAGADTERLDRGEGDADGRIQRQGQPGLGRCV